MEAVGDLNVDVEGPLVAWQYGEDPFILDHRPEVVDFPGARFGVGVKGVLLHKGHLEVRHLLLGLVLDRHNKRCSFAEVEDLLGGVCRNGDGELAVLLDLLRDVRGELQ